MKILNNALLILLTKELPQIYKLLDKYKMNHSIFIFKSRDEADNYIRNMEKKYANI